jgi:uncharacterized membrane protein
MLHKPLASTFMAVLFAFTLFFFLMAQFDVVALAFVKIGIPARYVFGALVAMLLGSFVNIPVKKIRRTGIVREQRTMMLFGPRRPSTRAGGNTTVVAVNLGGAVFPAIISACLLVKTGLYAGSLVGVLFMTAVCHRLARPVPGVGIALPGFFPPRAAARRSGMLSRPHAPVVAYISGTLGVLFGADVLNLGKLGSLNAPVASIGGAGTFDGIFLTGILAVLLSAFLA